MHESGSSNKSATCTRNNENSGHGEARHRRHRTRGPKQPDCHGQQDTVRYEWPPQACPPRSPEQLSNLPKRGDSEKKADAPELVLAGCNSRKCALTPFGISTSQNGVILDQKYRDGNQNKSGSCQETFHSRPSIAFRKHDQYHRKIAHRFYPAFERHIRIVRPKSACTAIQHEEQYGRIVPQYLYDSSSSCSENDEGNNKRHC